MPPFLPGPITYGIDISQWQRHPFPFRLAEQAEYRFAFMRASIRDDADPLYGRHFTRAWNQTTMALGSYHFLTTDVPPATQARKFVEVVQATGPLSRLADCLQALGPALDVERWGLTADMVRRWIDEFLRLWPVRLWIYTRKSFWVKSFGTTPWVAEYPLDLWVADYSWERLPDIPHPLMPPDWPDWAIWQYTSNNTGLPGYKLPLDKNLFRGTFVDLINRDLHDLTPGPWRPS